MSFILNDIHEKILESDWLSPVQFKRNTSTKIVIPVQITTTISEASPKKPVER